MCKRERDNSVNITYLLVLIIKIIRSYIEKGSIKGVGNFY